MPTPGQRGGDGRLVLQLLESVEQDGSKTQRRLAAELGIALGLVNAYLNRCVKKGLVKVKQAPARRYAYYLTPKGFVEKSRLSVEYLTYSFSFFREAKLDCLKVFDLARQRELTRLALHGVSDLAEIAIICARDSDIQIPAVVDNTTSRDRLGGIPIVRSYNELTDPIDGLVITRIGCTPLEIAAAVDRFGAERVLMPGLLIRAIREREVVP